MQICQAPSRQPLSSSVKASQVKGNVLIQLSYRASSVAVPEACVNAVESQKAIAEPLLRTMEEQLVLTKKQLTEAEGFQTQLEKWATSSGGGLFGGLMRRG